MFHSQTKKPKLKKTHTYLETIFGPNLTWFLLLEISQQNKLRKSAHSTFVLMCTQDNLNRSRSVNHGLLVEMWMMKSEMYDPFFFHPASSLFPTKAPFLSNQCIRSKAKSSDLIRPGKYLTQHQGLAVRWTPSLPVCTIWLPLPNGAGVGLLEWQRPWQRRLKRPTAEKNYLLAAMPLSNLFPNKKVGIPMSQR